ncbi:ferredoxin reductase family protein [Actinoplanes derwentensis]|uniref:Predicted ferric reductase n=1 Tax=Actinoplanes derwentensis TaxID=113562 RepID=A0A1H2DCG3_9ACTN|nr:ferredoxin reductase family protein [Actinoplanes derwentensis]SDT80433.1 Predicted ferric reductase [Actinoplanes derwentensis]
MSTTTAIPVTNRPARRSGQARTAYLLVWIFLLANAVILQIMFADPSRPANNTLTAIGRFFGLYLGFTLVVQLLLIGRVPFLERRIGMDKLTNWHRWTGFAIFWLVVLHPTFVLLGYSELDRISFFAEIPNLAKQMPVLLGMIAAALIGLMALTSVRMARRRMSYEAWHATHLVVYVMIVLAVIHQIYEGSSIASSSVTQAYWWALWAFAIGSLLVNRLFVPMVRNARHQLRVVAVVPETDTAVSVYVGGRQLDRMRARPGQFFWWRFPGHASWWQVNPWSLSAAPDGRTLRLTAKAIGSTSAGLRDLPVGTKVYAEGPYGALTTAARTRDNTLLIAGGIGITPIRALLEDPDLTGDVVVLYRARTPADAVLAGELRNLVQARGARLHLLTGRTTDGNQPFSPESLRGLVPDIAERDVYLCGPGAMATTVQRSLRALRVPARQRHIEAFRLGV